MEAILNFLDLLLFALELALDLLLLHVFFEDRCRVILNVIQIDVKSIRQVTPPSMFHILQVNAILQSIVEHNKESYNVDKSWNGKS
jgi:hypothetical protein